MNNWYDDYDYAKYWNTREYEHRSEALALTSFLAKIPHIKTIADIGGGYGRLFPYYSTRAKTIQLLEPSKKLLKEARQKLLPPKKTKLNFIFTDIKHSHKKLKNIKVDMIIMIRVAHHLDDIEEAISIISKILPSKGHLIMEFANKMHGKAIFQNLIKGNLTFPLDIFPSDISPKNPLNKGIPFKNYHPELIIEVLERYGLKVIEKRSVSNIRLPLLKKIFPINWLLLVESLMQKPLAKYYFGPSIFILAQKQGSN